MSSSNATAPNSTQMSPRMPLAECLGERQQTDAPLLRELVGSRFLRSAMIGRRSASAWALGDARLQPSEQVHGRVRLRRLGRARICVGR